MKIERNSKLWSYLEPPMQGLIADGEALVEDVTLHRKSISDYSYLLFPFSKAYEGFLKKLFLDLELIDESTFYGDEVRIGRILNPSFKHEKSSVYGRVRHLADRDISDYLWDVWKQGRNLVFHYYPHNFRKLTYLEAEDLVKSIVRAMYMAIDLVDAKG